MTPADPISPASLCTDADLGYEASRTRFAPGAGLRLDEAYRLAHLPLVAPGHPDAIPTRAGTFYDRGRHPRVVSLVLPVPGEALARSEAYRALEAELRASSFAGKIAWDILPLRSGKLHATVCGSLAVGDGPFALDPAQRRALARLGPLEAEVRGVFSGNVNVGRLYLRVYPERRGDGGNVLQEIQDVLGRRRTDLYLVGVWNLTDHLDAGEGDALGALIARWWERPLLRLRADRLWLLGARDDLVLDSQLVETVALSAGAAS